MPVKEVPTPEQEMNDRVELRMGLTEDRVAALESQVEHHANRLNVLLETLSRRLKQATNFLYGVLVGLLICAVIVL